MIAGNSSECSVKMIEIPDMPCKKYFMPCPGITDTL